MEVTVPSFKRATDRRRVYACRCHTALATFFKTSLLALHNGGHQGLAPLDHHDERIAVLVHRTDILTTGVPAIENKTDVPIVVRAHFVGKVAKLAHIID